MNKPISSLFNTLRGPVLAALLISSANAFAKGPAEDDLCEHYNEWGVELAMKTLDRFNRDADTAYKIEKTGANNYKLVVPEKWPENIYADVEAYSLRIKQILGALGNGQANDQTHCPLVGAINANNRVLEAITNYIEYVKFSIRSKIIYPDGSREWIL